jgi:hypothetical protein
MHLHGQFMELENGHGEHASSGAFVFGLRIWR